MSPKTELKYRKTLRAVGFLEGEFTDILSMEALRAVVTDAHPEPELVAKSTTDVWLPQTRELLARGVAPRAIAVVNPVDTEPGKVGQVDFGYVGQLFGPSTGMVRKAWAFVLTFGSRHNQSVDRSEVVPRWIATATCSKGRATGARAPPAERPR